MTLQIREKEIGVFTDNFAVLLTQSAFMTGLGFGGMTQVPTWGDGKKWEEMVYFTLVSASIGLNILTLCVAAWCMVFGPGLAIRGPDGSMKRAVDGMYLERKWALRFYWTGLILTTFSGIALAWLKYSYHDETTGTYHSITAILMTCIFFAFLVTYYIYIVYVTRPKFRFLKTVDGQKHKPEEFAIAGYDPEVGRYAGGSRGNQESTDSYALEANREVASPILRANQEIDWLRQQGMLSAADASKKKALLEEAQSSSADDSSSKGKTLRQRMFGGGQKRADGDSGDNALQTFEEARSMKGMLTRDGKLYRFELTDGKFTCSSPDGSLIKEWTLEGQKVDCQEKPTRSQPFALLVIIGKEKLKLAAGSADDVQKWSEAFRDAMQPLA